MLKPRDVATNSSLVTESQWTQKTIIDTGNHTCMSSYSILLCITDARYLRTDHCGNPGLFGANPQLLLCNFLYGVYYIQLGHGGQLVRPPSSNLNI